MLPPIFSPGFGHLVLGLVNPPRTSVFFKDSAPPSGRAPTCIVTDVRTLVPCPPRRTSPSFLISFQEVAAPC